MEWMLILAYNMDEKALLGPFAEPIACHGIGVTCVLPYIFTIFTFSFARIMSHGLGCSLHQHQT